MRLLRRIPMDLEVRDGRVGGALGSDSPRLGRALVVATKLLDYTLDDPDNLLGPARAPRSS
jgi:hypothetical protein